MQNKTVAVYCASSRNVRAEFLDTAEQLGRGLAKRNIEIIYGGGRAGLMGKVAEGALAEGGNITGVIPNFMMDLELGHTGLSKLHIVQDMHIRQAKMLRECDGVISLPGGTGTYTEFFEAVSWKRLGLVTIPIILVNIENFYDPMIEMLDRAFKEQFLAEEYRNLWKVAATIEETLEMINDELAYKDRAIEFDIDKIFGNSD